MKTPISRKCLILVLLWGLTASGMIGRGIVWAKDPVPVSLPGLFLSENLKVSSWVETGPTAVVGQQVKWIIEIASQTWFTQGTRLKPVELADAVILQADSFASNFIRRETHATWSVQQWAVSIYPMKEKTYHIPGIPIAVFVADGKGHTISGQVLSRPLTFEAVVPQGLANAAHWVATPKMRVRQWYSAPVKGLKAGDVVRRQVEIEADDVPAMMLPVVLEKECSGLAVYEDPPTLADAVNRGIRIGRRIEKTTYVIEKSGIFHLPGRVYVWWNVPEGRIETITLPDQTIEAAGFQKADRFFMNKKTVGFGLGLIVIFSATGALYVAARRYFKRKKRGAQREMRMSENQLRRALKKAGQHQEPRAFLRLLYTWFDFYGPGKGQTALRQFFEKQNAVSALADLDRLMAGLFGKSGASEFPVSHDPMRQLARLAARRSIFRSAMRLFFIAWDRVFYGSSGTALAVCNRMKLPPAKIRTADRIGKNREGGKNGK